MEEEIKPEPTPVTSFYGWWPSSEKRPGDLWLKPKELTPGMAIANSSGALNQMIARTLNPGPYAIKTPSELWAIRRYREETRQRNAQIPKPSPAPKVTLKKPCWKRLLGL